MPTRPPLPKLWTPEEIEDHYCGDINARRVRKLVAAGSIPCTRGAKRKVLFTEEQVRAVLAAMADPMPTAADAA